MTSAPQLPGIHVIIPARNMPDLVRACVESVVVQLGPRDVVTVVDDGSDDSTAAAAAAAGARILRTPTRSGPYVARHLAAASATEDFLLFMDARTHARPGLLDAHRRLLGQPATVMSCTEVEVLAGPTLAERMAVFYDFFSLSGKVGTPGRPDFYPTANLGVRRDVYEAVGGFRPLRSGSDSDLCWRIQFQGLGRMGVESARLMSWRPRTTLRALAEQNYRYGLGTAFLEWLHHDAMAEYRAMTLAATPLAANGPSTTKPHADRAVRIAAFVLHAVFRLGLARGHRLYKGVSGADDFAPMGARADSASV